MKQIIRNCPALDRSNTGLCLSEFIEEQKCEDCLDCLVKQVIKKCYDAIKTANSNKIYEDIDFNNGLLIQAIEILDMFEMEEI